MGDVGEYWKDVKPEMLRFSKLKRAANRENAERLLLNERLKFVVKNNGAHIIVSMKYADIDFWPGTGLWIMRGSSKRHRGVTSLLSFCKSELHG